MDQYKAYLVKNKKPDELYPGGIIRSCKGIEMKKVQSAGQAVKEIEIEKC
jgi:hypothetical protein